MRLPRALPRRLVASLPLAACAAAAAQAPDPAAAPEQTVEIVAVSPVGDTGVPADLYPANVQRMGLPASASAAGAGIAQVLQQEASSLHLEDTQGNGFQVDLAYRGFTASPILGTPQGLSVYLDGMRLNEPFGDIVSWDLVPQVALESLTLVPGSNPTYGLNTLGGALAMRTKTGFDFEGTELDVGGGAFGRLEAQAEYGHRAGAGAVYLAASTRSDHGWAADNPSRLHHFFVDVGRRAGGTTIDLSLAHAATDLAGNQLVPVSDLARPGQGYSRPDTTATSATTANLRFSLALDPARRLEGNLHLRHIARDIVNSNINDPVTPGQPDQAAFCQARYQEACAQNIATATTQRSGGAGLQLVDPTHRAGRPNYLTLGVNLEQARTNLAQAAQDAIVDAARVTVGAGPFAAQSAITSTTRDLGLFVTDTLVATPTLGLTASARYDIAWIHLAGQSVDLQGAPVDVGGDHRYARLNPSLGATLRLTPALTAFANLAQGSRAPSAVELACADPAHPCAGVPNAFSADPALHAVVARGVELGARAGAASAPRWRAAAFLTNLSHDIQFNQSSLSTGYFSNVGTTRRAGVELSLTGSGPRWDYDVSATWQRATFQSGFAVANGANPAPQVLVRPGDTMPGVPRLIGRLGLGWKPVPALRLEAQVTAQGRQLSRGNENHQPGGDVPGFATVKLAGRFDLDDRVELYAGVTNLFDRRYASFGMLGNDAYLGPNGTNENFLGVAPPRAVYAGVHLSL